MNRFRPTRYVLCFVLLFAMLSGLLGSQVALAAQEVINGSPSLPPSQEEPPPKPEFEATAQYPTMSTVSGQPFTFTISLTWRGTDAKGFDLAVTAPAGWIGEIKPGYEDILIESITLQPGKTYPDTVKVVLTPPPAELPEPGEYKATFNAGSGELKASVELTAVVTELPPTYQLYAYTASGRLSMEANAGKDNHLSVTIGNYGTGTLENITLSSTKSEDWSVTFNPTHVETLAPGSQQDLDVTITPPAKTIAGDYDVILRFSSNKATDNVEIRVTVVTPTIWGGAGIGIAVAVIAGLVVLFRRLGRR